MIKAVGSGDLYGLKEGDRVVYWGGEGGYAEYNTASAAKMTAIPADIELDVAAAATMQGLTALTMIEEAYAVQKGDWILVHAAAGGTGQMLCNLLRVKGAHTIATASSEAKLELAKAAGAEVLINYSTGGWKQKVLEVTGGEGVHAVFDGVGKDTFNDDLEVIRRKGTLVSFGSASGAVEPFLIAKLSLKNIKLLRPNAMNYVYTPEEYQHYMKEFFSLLLDGKIPKPKFTVYDLKDTKQAQDDLAGRKTTGKLLLKCS